MNIKEYGQLKELKQEYEDYEEYEKYKEELQKLKEEEENYLTEKEFVEDYYGLEECLEISHTKASQLFKEFRFKELFYFANKMNRENISNEKFFSFFFNIIAINNLKRIQNASKMGDFLKEVNDFLLGDVFNDEQKLAFLKDNGNQCIAYAIINKKFSFVEAINKYTKNKHLINYKDIITEKAADQNYAEIDQFLSISSSVVFNSSEFLRIVFSNNCRDYHYFKKWIETYGFDINGLGSIRGNNNEWTFAHAVAEADGTMSLKFFSQFIKDFGNQIDFDIQANKFATKMNLFDILLSSQLEISEKLNRLEIILNNCSLSEKHIAYVSQIILGKNGVPTQYYDHSVYEAFFKHEKFNSQLYDREAFLNKLMALDASYEFHTVRKKSEYTVNPTSVILDKFFAFAKKVEPLEQHPFVTWVKLNAADINFSIDTLNSLIRHYNHEWNDLELYKINMSKQLKEVLVRNGLVFPKKQSLFASLFKKKTPLEQKVLETTIEEKKIGSTNQDFNVILYAQVKDLDVKKYIDSIQLNAEQFFILLKEGNYIENDHYIKNLLPKFLNKTIENYLHFSTLDENEAKENVLVQLKLINKKTFEILSKGLSDEKDKIIEQGAIQNKILNSY